MGQTMVSTFNALDMPMKPHASYIMRQDALTTRLIHLQGSECKSTCKAWTVTAADEMYGLNGGTQANAQDWTTLDKRVKGRN